MVFPGISKYLSLSGALRGGETWSMGFRMTGMGFDGPQAGEEAALAELVTRIQTWWGTQNVMGAGVWLGTIKYNNINMSGKYTFPYTVRHDFPTQLSSASTCTHPNQVAMVATLETGQTRGLAHRGRIYLPLPPMPVGTDGKISEANATGAAATVKGLLDTINAAPGSGRVLIGSKVGVGAFRNVTGVSVGRVLDTMRSRRTSLTEGRMTAALAAVT